MTRRLVISLCLWTVAAFGQDVDARIEVAMKVSWDTTPGYVYELQSSTDLQTWTTVDGYPITATGTEEVYYADTDQQRRFFRVLETSGDVPPGFILVQAGTDAGGNVTVDEDFVLSQSEVTNQQMADVMQWARDQSPALVSATADTVQNASGDVRELLDLDGGACEVWFSGGTFGVTSGRENRPCVGVTWYGAVAYCNYLSESEGRTPAYDLTDWSLDPAANGYRLPSDSQWEYAARGGSGGTDTLYSGSDTVGDVAWYTVNSEGRSHDVGGKTANELGLDDMSGNVWEWCQDWHPNYVDQARTLRGGAWINSAASCTVSYRDAAYPDYSNSSSGFRPLLPAAGP